MNAECDRGLYSDWYVLFVQSGKEEFLAKRCQSLFSDDLIARVFVPRYQTLMQMNSVWVITEHVLFPGYLFIETRDIEKVHQELRKLPYFKRLLGKDGEKTQSILSAEKERLCRLMNVDNVIEASFGYKDGEIVEITKGALVGREREIKRIDRHKRTATVELELLGRSMKMKFGLELGNKAAVGDEWGWGKER